MEAKTENALIKDVIRKEELKKNSGIKPKDWIRGEKTRSAANIFNWLSDGRSNFGGCE